MLFVFLVIETMGGLQCIEVYDNFELALDRWIEYGKEHMEDFVADRYKYDGGDEAWELWEQSDDEVFTVQAIRPEEINQCRDSI
jgi:hypothetical protein